MLFFAMYVGKWRTCIQYDCINYYYAHGLAWPRTYFKCDFASCENKPEKKNAATMTTKLKLRHFFIYTKKRNKTGSMKIFFKLISHPSQVHTEITVSVIWKIYSSLAFSCFLFCVCSCQTVQCPRNYYMLIKTTWQIFWNPLSNRHVVDMRPFCVCVF